MTDEISRLRRILADYRNVAVVGLSANWYRPSYFAAKYLLDHGYNVIPVNPVYPEILGCRSYPDLRSIPEPVDVVDIFRRPEEVPALVDEAVAIGAKVVWMQIGIVHEEAAARAREAGLEVVMNRCMKIEYGRLFGGLNWMGVNTGVISAKRPAHVPF
ncbi:CoA-binding protein [Aquisalimonas lutea]|uniref:CoA-binding protein n=1 Tax=Aquisalimonas lutea TaxID=1327750 RepID=UPI00338E9E2E